MTNGPDSGSPPNRPHYFSAARREHLDLMPLPNQPRADRTSSYAKAEGESGLYEFREGAFRTRSFCAAAVDCALCRRGGQQTLKLGRADAIELLHLTKLVSTSFSHGSSALRNCDGSVYCGAGVPGRAITTRPRSTGLSLLSVANGDIELVHKRPGQSIRRVLRAEVEGKPVGLVRGKLLVNGDFNRLALRGSVRQAYVVRRR